MPKQKIYLMERITNRQLKTILTFKREIKIGISNKPLLRKKQVDSGIPGKIILLEEYSVANAAKIEKALHRLYDRKNIVIHGAKKGSGSTELFRLSNSELNELKAYLRTESGEPQPSKAIAYVFLLSVIIAIIAKILIIKNG